MSSLEAEGDFRVGGSPLLATTVIFQNEAGLDWDSRIVVNNFHQPNCSNESAVITDPGCVLGGGGLESRHSEKPGCSLGIQVLDILNGHLKSNASQTRLRKPLGPRLTSGAIVHSWDHREILHNWGLGSHQCRVTGTRPQRVPWKIHLCLQPESHGSGSVSSQTPGFP